MPNTLLKLFTWLLILIAITFYFFEIYQVQLPKDTPHKISQSHEELVEWAKTHLSQKGILKEDSSGFVYLKVDDAYITELYPRLHEPRYRMPTGFSRKHGPGAHVSVFYANERHHIHEIKEINHEYSFKILNIEVVPPHHHAFIVIKIHSPELEKLREKYGLPALLKQHEFHITIAKKRQNVKNHVEKPSMKKHSHKDRPF